MQILSMNKFDQCVLTMALINICNQEGYVGEELRRNYNLWKSETGEAAANPWLDSHWFTIYIPHPDQEYEQLSQEEGLSQGYNIEVKPLLDTSSVPYKIPAGGHFVIVLKQKGLQDKFEVAATGIFVRPLGVLSLDVVTDWEQAEYQSLLIKHPIIRDYPAHWEQKLRQFMAREIRSEELPQLVGYVDQAINRDYRSPSWDEVYLAAYGFAGV